MIELAAVVRDLREELGAAITAAKDEQLRFELGPIEVEATVVVDRSTDIEGKIRFWIVELGAEKKNDSISTLRISLSLTPTLEGTSRRVRISGPAEPGEC